MHLQRLLEFLADRAQFPEHEGTGRINVISSRSFHHLRHQRHVLTEQLFLRCQHFLLGLVIYQLFVGSKGCLKPLE